MTTTASLESLSDRDSRSKMLRRFLVPFAACLLLAPGPCAAAAEFRIGAARRIITPNPLLPLSGGMGPTAPATEKKGELTASALVLERDQVRVAIVSVDLLGFPAVLGDRARARVQGIPAEHILIGASHTHSAPDCYAFPDGQGGHTGDLTYMDFVCDRIAEAVNDALARLQPARLRIATGKAAGKIAYNYYAPALYDDRVSIVQAVGGDDAVIATLVNYAVHPEVLGSDKGVCSPDLVGPLRDRIESQCGGLAMFMNGAQGGMVTADNRDLSRPKDALRAVWEDDRTWDECVRIGHTLADEALRIVGEAPLQADPQLSCHWTTARFPIESDELWAVVVHSPLGYPHADDRSVSTRINLVELGDARILTIPGEALPNLGFYLKRQLGARHNLLFGLTNDAFGYIMTKVDYDSFPRYDYITRVSPGEMTGEILIDRALGLVNQLKSEDYAP